MAPPDDFNIALDCVDKHGAHLVNKHHPALIYFREEAPGVLKNPPLRLDFSSLRTLTNCMANALARTGIGAGERIVVALPNGAEFPVSFLGAVKAGAIPIPASPLLTFPELEFILKDSGAAALIAHEEFLPPEIFSRRPDSLKHLLVVTRGQNEAPSGALRWQTLLKEAPAQWTTQPTPADDPAYWLYTSGTAGRPKAVIHAHRSIRAHDARAKIWQDLKAADVVFNTSALNWSYALISGMLDVWRHGLAAVVFNGAATPENILEVARRSGTTVFMSVPGIYRRLTEFTEAGKAFPHNVRVCLSAGEHLPDEIRARFRAAAGLEIREGLGMTEHSIYLVQAQGDAVVPGSCGKFVPGQQSAILRGDLATCAPGETGILATHRSGSGLMLGYHQRPGEEAAAFRGDWFLTGDRAYADGDGNVFFAGREDDTINAGGFRISPLEIESALNAHEDVGESAAVGRELEPGKTIVQAFVALKPGCGATQAKSAELLDWARQRLAPYKMPREVIFLRELPKTANGKLQRKELRDKIR